jgi:hypothetical protein
VGLERGPLNLMITIEELLENLKEKVTLRSRNLRILP